MFFILAAGFYQRPDDELGTVGACTTGHNSRTIDAGQLIIKLVQQTVQCSVSHVWMGKCALFVVLSAFYVNIKRLGREGGKKALPAGTVKLETCIT